MTEQDDRRPIRSRDTGWAKSITGFLVSTGVSPNQISVASVAFAAAAALSYSNMAGPTLPWLLIVGAAGILLRLLCNMFDGMVAVEGGKGGRSGGLFNELPDRFADALILLGVGYGLGSAFGPTLGWAATALAVLTAYVRALGTSLGAPSDFSGPMAKPHRMQLLIFASLLAVAEPFWGWQGETLTLGLLTIVIGSAVTVIRRSWTLYRWLERDGNN